MNNYVLIDSREVNDCFFLKPRCITNSLYTEISWVVSGMKNYKNRNFKNEKDDEMEEVRSQLLVGAIGN